MVGCIEAGNAPSLRLHARLGFERTGYMPRVGSKFGRWLDLVCVQRALQPPPPGPSLPDGVEDGGVKRWANQLTECRCHHRLLPPSDVPPIQTVAQAAAVLVAMTAAPRGLGVVVGWKAVGADDQVVAIPLFASALLYAPARPPIVTQWTEFLPGVLVTIAVAPIPLDPSEAGVDIVDTCLAVELLGSRYEDPSATSSAQRVADGGANVALLRSPSREAIPDAVECVVMTTGHPQEHRPTIDVRAASVIVATAVRQAGHTLRSGEVLFLPAGPVCPRPAEGSVDLSAPGFPTLSFPT